MVSMSGEAELPCLLSDKWIQGLTFEAFVAFSRKNVERMRENYERTVVPDALAAEVEALDRDARLLVIGADWCGDVVANVPSIARLADLNEKRLQLRILDRDRHDDLMRRFLTDGTRSIPIVIIGPPNFARHGHWGPRPAECQRIMTENKEKLPKEQIVPLIRDWYGKDAFQSVLQEVWAVIKAQTG